MLNHARIHTIMTKIDFLTDFHERVQEALQDIKECSEDLSPEYAMRQSAYWRGYLRGMLSQAYNSNVINTDTFLVYWGRAKMELDGAIGEVLFHE